MEVMLGEAPGPVDDARFLDAWVELAGHTLRRPD